MTDNLEQLLTRTAPEPSRPPEPEAIWASARQRARRTAALAATAATAVAVVGVGGLLFGAIGPATPQIDPLGGEQPGQDEQPVFDDDPADDQAHAEDPVPKSPGPEPEPQGPDTATPTDPPPSDVDRGEDPGPVRAPAESRDDPTSTGGQEHWSRLAERSFRTRTYHRDGQRFDLVDDTELEVLFTDDSGLGPGIVFHAGCNTQGGSLAGITADRIRFDDGGGTDVGCGEALESQDAWIHQFVMAGPHWQLDGDRLELTAGNTRLELTEAPWTVWER